jgi:hypothetical protein
VESGGLVIVNLNDALNSNHRNVVEMFLRVVKKHWPDIDILISGFSGAGYFPNQVRYPGKDDMEIGRIREHYFAHNLCTFADFLRPRLIVPFAPGFALLEEHNRWVNEVKFDRERLPAYHEEHVGPLNGSKYLSIWPGDRFVDMDHQPASPYRDQLQDGGLYHLLDEVYGDEIVDVNTIRPHGREKMEGLLEKARTLMDHNRKLYDEVVLREAHFTVAFRDVEGMLWDVHHTPEGFRVEERTVMDPASRITITTTARLLEVSLSRLWGGDALQAYGIVVEMFDQDALDKNLDIVCVRLLCRYPIMREDIRKHAFRAAKYFLTNPSIAALHMKQKVKLRPYVNRFPYNERDHWISTTKCELCNVCQIPVIEYA